MDLQLHTECRTFPKSALVSCRVSLPQNSKRIGFARFKFIGSFDRMKTTKAAPNFLVREQNGNKDVVELQVSQKRRRREKNTILAFFRARSRDKDNEKCERVKESDQNHEKLDKRAGPRVLEEEDN